MRWYLIRHAQTIWNEQDRLQGHCDTPLSVLGQRQVACLRQHFATRPIGCVISSHLPRTQTTAQGIAEANGHRPARLIEPRLAEIHLGEWEGLTPGEIDARYGQAYQRWRLEPSAVTIPSGEPLQAFRDRVRAARDALLAGATPEAEATAVVSHGGVIAALLADVLGVEYDRLMQRLRLDNGGITALEFNEHRQAHVLWINSTMHLDGGAAASSKPW